MARTRLAPSGVPTSSGPFSRVPRPDAVRRITRLCGVGVPARPDGSHSRVAAAERQAFDHRITRLCGYAGPARPDGPFTREAAPPAPARPGFEIAGLLLPEPLEILRRPRHFRYEGVVELEAFPRGRWTIELSEWEYWWPGLVQLIVDVGADYGFDSPIGRMIARALRDDEEAFDVELF